MTAIAADTPERTMLREAHRVRLLSPAQEGTGLLQLHGGIYGFTHSPGAQNAPLFATPTSHSFEVHRLQDSAVLIAYVDRESAAVLEHAPEDVKIVAHPFSHEAAPIMVAIEWSRLHLPKRYVTPSPDGGIDLQVYGRK